MKSDIRVTYANADYTGGGIYCYHGKLSNGQYFVTDDDCPSILLTDEEPKDFPSGEWVPNWEKSHEVMDANLWAEMFRWIIAHKPVGNYAMTEIMERFRCSQVTADMFAQVREWLDTNEWRLNPADYVGKPGQFYGDAYEMAMTDRPGGDMELFTAVLSDIVRELEQNGAFDEEVE